MTPLSYLKNVYSCNFPNQFQNILFHFSGIVEERDVLMLPSLDHSYILHSGNIIVSEQNSSILKMTFLFNILKELFFLIFILKC